MRSAAMLSLARPQCLLLLVTIVPLLSSPALAQPPREPRGEQSAPPDRRQAPPGMRPGRSGPGPMRPDGPMGGRPWTEWPEPERKQVEKFLEENFPRMFVELQRLKEVNERRYVRRMTRIAPQMRRIMETMRTDPQLGALMIRERQIDMQIWQTVARYRSATDDAAKAALRAELEKLAGQAFDCRHERRDLEVRQLEARLSVLKTRLSESEKMRDDLIAGRVTELLERKTPLPAPDESDDSDEE